MFSKEKAAAVKGIICLGVICFHLTFVIEGKPVFNSIFWNTGYLFVGIFFFISGYGMSISLQNNASGYSEKIIKSKIPKLLIPYLIIFIVYFMAFKCIGNSISLKQALISLINGHSIVENSWYVYAIIIFSLFMIFAWKAEKKEIRFWVLTVLVMMYCIVCWQLGLGKHWIYSCSGFVFGVYWAICENRNIIYKYPKMFFLISMIYMVAERLNFKTIKNEVVKAIVCGGGGCIAVSILMLLFINKFSGSYKFLNVCSKISYEIYLCHGLVILILCNSKWKVRPYPLLIVLTLIGSVAFAFIWNKCNKWIFERLSIGV